MKKHERVLVTYQYTIDVQDLPEGTQKNLVTSLKRMLGEEDVLYENEIIEIYSSRPVKTNISKMLVWFGVK